MTWQAWFTLGIVVLTVILLAKDLVTPAVSVFGAAIVLLVARVITPAEAFSGFSNEAPITVAALYILARAVEKTGGLFPILNATLGAGKGRRMSLARLLVPAAGASAFLNNTPIVAMLVGPVTDWANRNDKPPSRYLLPLSYAVILGGVVTVMGTSTNLVVSGLLEHAGYKPIGLFEITWVGLPVCLAGLAMLLVLTPTLLPDRRAPSEQMEANLREFSVAMKVVPGGPLDGQAVAAGGLRHLKGVYLVEIERGGQTIAPVDPNTTLVGGDRLSFVGAASLIVDLQMMRGLESAEAPHLGDVDAPSHTFFEAVVGEASPLVNKTLKESDFRARYQAAVIAIHRAGHRVEAKLGTVKLHVGDTLLLLADPKFAQRWRDRSDFLLVARRGGATPSASKKAPLVGLLTLAIVVVAGMGLMPMLQTALLGVMALIAFRVLTPSEARNAVDMDVIVMIAASFGIGAAIQKSGLADVLASGLIHAFSGWGAKGVLLGVLLATLALVEVITHNAAAVLCFPIGLAAAHKIGADVRPFAMAIAIAASSSFLTPVGYQTNTMVYGPGGYKFGDYARLGFPLTILVVIVSMLVIPVVWPLP